MSSVVLIHAIGSGIIVLLYLLAGVYARRKERR